MKFRYARHTNNLKAQNAFYRDIIGLDELGRFQDHDNYSGVFLGRKNADWHLEFTESSTQAIHTPDADDLIVFYLYSEEEMNTVRQRAKVMGIHFAKSLNPYWQKSGFEIKDPDGFGVIISLTQQPIIADDGISTLAKGLQLQTWDELLRYLRQLPYGRTSNRSDLSLVLSENRGTCSSKHALAKQLADNNNIDNVELILAIYKMSEKNTAGIGTHLSESKLDYIPEAHCYLKVNGQRIDLTNRHSDILKLENDIILETSIKPEQVGDYKVTYHKTFIKQWRTEKKLPQTLEELWSIREQCIQSLAMSR